MVLARETGLKAFDHQWAKEYGRAVDGHWRSWADDPGHYCDAARNLTFGQMMRVGFRHELVDGDAVALMPMIKERVGYGRADYGTCVQLVDPDRLSNPQQVFDAQSMRGGVEVDQFGAAVAYHIRKAHQGDWWAAADAATWVRVPRETLYGRPMVVHHFVADRAGQHRGGAGIFTPIMQRLKMLVKYDGSELDAAIINAIFAACGDHVVRRLQTAMARFGDVSGINRVGGALRGVARAGTEAYQRVGQLVPLIGIVGSAASVAGVTRMVEAWTALGSRAGFAAQRIGISAGQLTAFQGAGRLAGASADGVTSGLQALGQTMYDALGGRAPEAVVMFRTLCISFSDAAGHAKSVTEVLPQVADKIAAIRNPFAQAQVATTLFGGAAEELLPFLRRGSDGIRDYVLTAERYGAISDVGARAAERLRDAQAHVSLAVDGLRNRIAERLEPVLTPLLMRFAEWLAMSPAVAHAVDWLGIKVGELGRWIEGGGIQRFGETIHGWLEPIGSVVHFLGGDGGVLGAVEGLAAFMVGSFALKVIAPWFALARAIVAATATLARFTAMQAAGAGGAGLLGRLGGLAGGLAMGAAGWEGLNWLQGATEPQSNGLGNLLHNFLFDMDPGHWTRSYHPGQEDRAGGGRPALGRPDQSSANIGAAPQGDMAAREKQAYDYFVSQGRSPQAAAGIVASLERESLGNEKNNTGDGGAAYGIGQWHADRQEHFRQIFGHDIRQSNLGEQLQFKRMELDGTGGDAGSATAGQMMRGYGTTARQVGGYDSMYAERPGDREGEASRRGALAEAILNRQIQRQPQADPIAPPSAKGEALALASPDRRDDNADPQKVHLHITGDGRYRAQVLESSSAVKVEGPLVERPGLLGAQA